MVTVSGFIAEVGDIGRFDNPKQLQKLAGYAIVANDSGKHNGKSRISYRGRKRLRYVLYEAAISLVGKNAEFREIHEYYRTKEGEPAEKDAVGSGGSLQDTKDILCNPHKRCRV